MIYSIIGTVAMFLTPLAASIAFGWRVYSEVFKSTDESIFLAGVAGIGAAVGLEAVGMLAGHVATDYQSRNDWRWVIAGAILLLYTYIGWDELRGSVTAVIFIISPLVYILVALKNRASVEAAEIVDGAAVERLQAVEDTNAQHRREMEILAAKQQHSQELKRIAAQPQPKPQPKPKPKPQQRGVNRNGTATRKIVYEYIKAQPSETNAAIGRQVGISRTMVGKYRKELVSIAEGK